MGKGESMGSPELYYKRMLQSFAHCLASDLKQPELAKHLYKEDSIIILEDFITQNKAVADNMFYFNAGRACESVISESANNDSNDGFNACAGGLCDFMSFLGLEES